MIARLFAVALVGLALLYSPALADPPVVKLVITADGAFQIDGRRDSDDAQLRAKIAALIAQRPQPSFVIVTVKPSAPAWKDQIKMIGEAVLILQKAGVERVGFIVQPNPD